MRASTLSALALTFGLIASSNAANTSGELRKFIGSDLTGEFDLFVQQGSCPKKILHKEFFAIRKGIYSVPHSKILQNGQKCTDDGALGVLTKEAIENAGVSVGELFKTGQIKSVVDALEKQNTEFLVGYEQSERKCGTSKLAAGATFVFVEDEKKIKVPGLIELFPGAKYMIVYHGDSPTPCTYAATQSGRVIGLPAPSPKPIDAKPAPLPAGSGPLPGSGKESDSGSGTGTGSDSGSKSNSPPAESNSSTDSDSSIKGSPSTDVTSDEAARNDDIDMLTEMPTATPEPEDDGASACFPADAKVQLVDQTMKRMDQLTIGDRIAVGGGKFSEVFMFTHRDEFARTSFVQLATSSGATLQLSASHYLYVNDRMVAARGVRVSDNVQLEDGSSSTVVAVHRVIKNGLYNPQTVHGDIVVSGVRASTYTASVHPSAAHSLLVPLRTVFRALGMSLSVLDKGSETFARVAPKGHVEL